MFENIQLAFQGVFGHKLRSFLTMLGIIIGIASIITIISTIKGTNEQIKQNLIGSGSNIVNVQLYQNDWAVDMSYQTPDGIRVLQDEQRDEMIALDGVADVTLYRSRENVEGFYYRNTGFSGKLYGVDDHYFSVYGYEVRSGRGFTARDFASASKNVILDETAAKTLFSSDDPIGKIVEISGEPFTVVGVVSQKSSFEPRINSVKDYAMYVQESSGLAFVPTSVWPVLYRFDEPQNVAVRATSTDTMTDAGKAVADYLTSHQIIASKATGDNSYSYRSDDLLKQAQQLQEMSSATNNQLIWIASISLLVGGVGVMNIMLVTVTERTAEIGLKKAIGAKRRRILAQFLTEASVLTGIGGILGVLGGMGPQATNTFYQRIIDRTQADTDQEHLRVLIWSDAKIPDRTAGILGTPEQAEAVFAHLLVDAKLLEGAGCTVLAIPCNTSHYFADRLQAQLHVPIIHMIRETVKTIQAMGKQTVGILATDGTVQTGIYQNELTAAGLTPVTLPEELQKTVMSIIYDEIKKGETGSREKFGEIDAYLRSVGCDCAILGCTELSVYRTLHSLPPFYIDAMEILAEQAILRCGKQLRNV